MFFWELSWYSARVTSDELDDEMNFLRRVTGLLALISILACLLGAAALRWL